jgi:hypothetical protein
MDTAMIAVVLGFSLRLVLPFAILLGAGTWLRRAVRGQGA